MKLLSGTAHKFFRFRVVRAEWAEHDPRYGSIKREIANELEACDIR